MAKKPTVAPSPPATRVVELHEDIALDPESLWAGYRRWQKLSRNGKQNTSPTLADSQFRSALRQLRNQITATEPTLKAATVLPLVPPSNEPGGLISGPVRSALWRRQSDFNEAVCSVVNNWPSHSQSAAGYCWLIDEVQPHIDALPLPNRSHRSSLAVRLAVRSAKAAVAMSVVATRAGLLKSIHTANSAIFRALLALSNPTPPTDDEIDQLVADLHAVVAMEGNRRGAPGYDDQLRFLKKAAIVLSCLLLPAEGALDALYAEWRTRTDALQRDDDETAPSHRGRMSIVFVGSGAHRAAELSHASLACQPGDWEAFVQSDGRPSSTIGTPAVLPLADIRQRVKGAWIALVNESVVFGPRVVEDVLRAGSGPGSPAIQYSDHDLQLGVGGYTQPFFKPGWSPELFLETNYVGGVVFVSREKFLSWTAGKERIGPGDLSRLLFSAHTAKEPIHRIPRVLWHRTANTSADAAAHATAVAEFLKARGEQAELLPHENGQRVRFEVKGNPRVSLVVPFKDKPELLEQLVSTLFEHETYRNYELVLVSNNSKNSATTRLLRSLDDPRIKKHEWNYPFNYQTLNNEAVRQWCSGEYLVFLNNDVSWGEGGALEEMLGQCQRPEIGAVGANLLYPSGRLQHSGVTLGVGGFAAHAFCQTRPAARWTAYGLPSWTRNYLAVTAACLMVRRSVFDEVKGFDEDFVVSGGDVDLCLRIGAKGYRIVNTPHVALTHHESATRTGMQIPDSDAWKSYMSFHRYVRDGDPYYNPNLSLVSMDCLPATDERTGEELALQFLTTQLHSSRVLADT